MQRDEVDDGNDKVQVSVVDPPANSVLLQSRQTGAQVLLLGSVHLSHSSKNEVAEAIENFKPDTVFLELCRSRASIVFSDPTKWTNNNNNANNETSWKEKMKLVSSSKSGILQLLLGTLMDRLGKQVKAMPGAEFKEAFLAGRKVGANIVLGDRPVEITLQRAWLSLSLWQKIKLCYAILKTSRENLSEEDVEKLKNLSDDVLTQLLSELKSEFPSLSTSIVEERDMYMAISLRELNARRIVAVVGRGHIQGIARYWENYNISKKELMSIPPPKKNWLKFLTVGGLLTLGVFWFLRYYKR
eukprot:TRINITY_DN6351_c0_g1_i1.p1 TRINITY_DN6351_c0_g1~~TRINITY_DN6351_c0_g1_i1.p1  ORF type:complete len:300 (-),score=56.28 TRINITY_DN6351_c0_g1_i1:302-1201(-)